MLPQYCYLFDGVDFFPLREQEFGSSSSLSVPILLQENSSLCQGFPGVSPGCVTPGLIPCHIPIPAAPDRDQCEISLEFEASQASPAASALPSVLPSWTSQGPRGEEQQQNLHQGPKCSRISLVLYFLSALSSQERALSQEIQAPTTATAPGAAPANANPPARAHLFHFPPKAAIRALHLPLN